MAKVLKIVRNSIVIFIEVLVIALIALAFLIRTAGFQTFLAHQATDFLSHYTSSEVSIGKVDLASIDKAFIDEVYVEDLHQDTLFYIKELYVSFSPRNLLNKKFEFEQLKIKEAKTHLKKYENEDFLNLKFFVDAFKTSKDGKEETDFKLVVKEFEITESCFMFKDENVEHREYGIDFKDLYLKDINVVAEQVVIYPKSYQADFKKISFKEKSGFELEEFVSNAIFNEQGLAIGESYISTKESDIYLDEFYLKSNSLKDFAQFVDSVKVEGQLEKSMVSFADISYFAPQLKGMDDVVLVSGNTKDVINRLEILDLNLKYGQGTEIAGNFYLPDFKKLSKENLNQNISYFLINVHDLERIKLPESAKADNIKWPKSLDNIHYFSGRNIKLRGGLDSLQIKLADLNTNIGSFTFNEGFYVKTDTLFRDFIIQPTIATRNLIEVNDLQLSQLIKNNNFRNINGVVGIEKVLIDNNGVKVQSINGVLQNTSVFDYTYDYIALDNIDYHFFQFNKENQSNLKGKVFIRDESFDLTYQGKLNIGNYLDIDAQIDIECAMLEMIHPKLENRGELIASAKVKTIGRNFNDFVGTLVIDSLFYEEGGESFQTKYFRGFVQKSATRDSISIRSDIVDATIDGILDYSMIVPNIRNQLAKIFPIFFESDEIVINDDTEINYDVKVKNINDVLNIFYPVLEISNHATINGFYDGKSNNIDMIVMADYINYQNYHFNKVYAFQDVKNDELMAVIDISGFYIDDSITYRDVHFISLASQGELDSQILFFDNDDKISDIQWLTLLHSESHFDLGIRPSFLYLSGNRWEIKKTGFIQYENDVLTVDGVKLQFKNQSISASGKLSDSDSHRLRLIVNSLNLEEFGEVLGRNRKLSGIANVDGYLSTPKTNMQFEGSANIKDLYVNETEVGELKFNANYLKANNKINVDGNLRFRDVETFKFTGDYSLDNELKDEILDFDLFFDKTDIAVVNEFLDPTVIKKLKGKLNGELKLTGSFEEPLLTGTVNFDDGLFNLAILGADVFFEGEIESVKDGFYINTMPIRDQEGNVGFINGALDHRNFKNFFFEININLEDHPYERLANDRSRPLPVERFLVMNTDYDINNPYYGTGYITGMVNISGYTDNLAVIVNAKTQRGTKFVLPMYGPTTIEEDGFITFKKESVEIEEIDKRVDLTGIDLELNFEVTDEAEVKIVFDEKIGDELSARGNGNISLSVDQFNELAMDGTFTVSSGSYNFVLGPYSQKFNINPGGTVQWVGDPYEAILNLEAYYKTMANLSVVMPDVIENKKSNNEEIYSYLHITGELSNPNISFDIDAPKASESGKAIINRIRSDKDELNQQFFSIIISKSFTPLSGQLGLAGQTSGVFLDMASTQINNLLNRFSGEYNMNVNLENDDFSGQFSGELGVSKTFLDDRLFVSGSFGVGTRRVNGGEENVPNQSTFIGDVRIEYLLNKSGTFRMNAFNESNNNFLLQNEGRGLFTQGIGLSYMENFHNFDDFKMFQFFANTFRKRENWVMIREDRREEAPIPDEYYEK